MYASRKLLLTITSFIVVFSLILIPAGNIVTSAKTLDEIQAEIDAENAKLSSLQGQIDAAQKDVNNLQSQLGSTQGAIPQLENQISQIEATITYNNLQMQKLTNQQNIMELEAQRREKQQDRALKNAYYNWRSDSKFSTYLLNETHTDPMKKDIYQSAVMDTEKLSIDEIVGQISDIKAEITKFKAETGDLEQQNQDLQARKTSLQAQILALQSSINGTQGQVAGLQAQANVAQSKISQLSAEQKALQDYEAWILGQNSNGGTQTIQNGQMYFTGKGRDLYQGHGVGMSQFGAYGAAKNAGWSAAQIVTFYYTNTQVGTSSANINVQGYGSMDLNTYAAGQGEVPAKACGNADQVASRPDKYVLDTGNFWACWPEEAIKAQIIAFRSYALYNQINYGGSICTDASCQVYNGSQNSKWAADETKDQVIVYNGNVIQALYSSDNNNGIGGTANNETRFSDFAGNGTPVPYLRSVNDTAFAASSSWTNWNYRTNGYNMNATIKQMLQFEANDGNLTGDARAYVAGIRDTVGDIAAINFQRDPSQRVTKVTLTGNNGASINLAGWFFKAIWNSWIDQVQPSGQQDFIYSQTYFLVSCSNAGGCS